MTDKWGRRLFKTGAVLLLVLGLVHSLSLISPPVPANDTERQLLDLANNYKFNLMRSQRSLWNLFLGFSICFTLATLGFGALDLVLSREPSTILKRVALVNALWLAIMTAISLRYFFAAPTFFLALPLLAFILAWLQLPAAS